jgi:F-type H+-transporting ATPase subunit epsilon
MSAFFSYKLVTPEVIYLEGKAELITVPGIEGDIGFLAQHTNFITSIRPGMIKVTKDDNTNIQCYVDGGFVKFSENELLLVAEEVVDENEVNSEFINQKIEVYNEQLSNALEIEKNKIISKLDSLKLLLN